MIAAKLTVLVVAALLWGARAAINTRMAEQTAMDRWYEMPPKQVPITESLVEGYLDNQEIWMKLLNASGSVKDSIPEADGYEKLIVKLLPPWPVLSRDLLTGLSNVTEIVLAKNNFREIQPYSFNGVTGLQVLDLNTNDIEEIRVGMFDGLGLVKLDLSCNKIRKIESRALDDLPNLETIKFSYNQIVDWNPDLFRNTPKLYEINLSYNLIKVLPAEAFANLENDRRTREARMGLFINLMNNKIEEVPPEAFYGLSRIKTLWLSYNMIEHLDSRLLEGVTVEWINLNDNKIKCLQEEELNVVRSVTKRLVLDGNPINCTCLKRMKEWLGEYESRTLLKNSQMKCDLDEGFDRLHIEFMQRLNKNN